MRIDLPLCNLKTCRYSFDGNCTRKDKYAWCEHTLAKKNAFTELTPKSEGLPYCLACGQKLDWNASNNTCVCCGEIIPEGRQVCPKCERG